MTTTNPKAYALLIGVGDYSTFDPTGAANLEGPTNDVAGWLNIVRDLGVPAANIRICRATPPGAPALDVEAGVEVTGADRADLVAGLDWLAAALDGEGGVKAVLSWSGHGTRTADGEVLCPSDVAAEGSTLKNGLAVAEVAARLAKRAKGTRITALMDVCHDSTGFDRADSGRARIRALRWHGAAAKPTEAHGPSHAALGDRVLSSSRTGTPSYDIPVIDGVHGAFSWATSNLIQRHGLVEGDAGATAGITFAMLAEHCGQILEGMRVAQRPAFHGGGGAAKERVFSAWGDRLGDAGAQSLTPEEIWPGVPDAEGLGGVVRYELTAADSTVLGDLYITTDKAPGSWTANVQYWPFTFTTWPTGSFTATCKGDDNVPSSPPTGGSVYSNGAMGSGTGKTVTWDGTVQPLYAVTDLTTSTTAYFKIKANGHGLKVACTAASGGYVASSYTDTVQFVPKPSAQVTKTYAVLDTPLLS